MRKLFLLSLASLLLSFSCETSSTEEMNDLNIDLSKVENLRVMKHNEQRIAYRLLNKDEKFKLWDDRLSSLIALPSTTEIQKKSIINLSKILETEFFSSNNEKGVSINEEIKGWIIENESKFSREKFILYFTTLNEVQSDNGARDDLVLDPGEDIEDCECNELEDYCIGISFECHKTKCDDSYKGCGFLWNSSCNGECEHKDA
ncbi:MAG: hypothetical protein ED556_01225 [Winogradskyella sp.]|uniref:bacteriocin fulvocin C-related protein n=1 Tax=Winogradskyella sp. TaxID=1883156 RepID=UPI000F3B9DFC|nr:bacteriocin fulvocin C-related protein [Winogradskyella sp.]RNC87840.1 MAG: hypothetical protein ED556_01225 [Winogradskyella sp.]